MDPKGNKRPTDARNIRKKENRKLKEQTGRRSPDETSQGRSSPELSDDDITPVSQPQPVRKPRRVRPISKVAADETHTDLKPVLGDEADVVMPGAGAHRFHR